MAYDPTHEYEHNYHPSIEARKNGNNAATPSAKIGSL